MSTTHFDEVRTSSSAVRIPGWIWPTLLALGLLAVAGKELLNDPDSYWQTTIGQWIIANDAFPRKDIFSFTMKDQPWTSTSWAAQVAFALVSRAFGWNGVVLLTVLATCAAIAFQTRFLMQRIAAMPACILSLASLILLLPHLLARPHALALPIMVYWSAQLIDAADRRETPSLWLLPVITLWANVHGSFVLGLAFIGAMAIDAIWNSEASQQKQLLLRWMRFGVLAVLASCVTPYAWGSLLAALKILTLGNALLVIAEWQPADFSSLTAFELIILVGFALALRSGVKLPPLRLLMVLGLVHLALSSARHADTLAALAPMLLAMPLAQYVGGPETRSRESVPFVMLQAGAVALIVAFGLASFAMRSFAPPKNISPVEAVAVLKKQKAERVLNDYHFGGYMIAHGLPTFIDGRTELYGTDMMMSHDKATRLTEPAELFMLLDKYNIDATLLTPKTPAAKLLDRTEGWQRLFADDVSVVHIRKPVAPPAQAVSAAPAKGKAKSP